MSNQYYQTVEKEMRVVIFLCWKPQFSMIPNIQLLLYCMISQSFGSYVTAIITLSHQPILFWNSTSCFKFLASAIWLYLDRIKETNLQCSESSVRDIIHSYRNVEKLSYHLWHQVWWFFTMNIKLHDYTIKFSPCQEWSACFTQLYNWSMALMKMCGWMHAVLKLWAVHLARFEL